MNKNAINLLHLFNAQVRIRFTCINTGSVGHTMSPSFSYMMISLSCWTIECSQFACLTASSTSSQKRFHLLLASDKTITWSWSLLMFKSRIVAINWRGPMIRAKCSAPSGIDFTSSQLTTRAYVCVWERRVPSCAKQTKPPRPSFHTMIAWAFWVWPQFNPAAVNRLGTWLYMLLTSRTERTG